MLNPEPPGPEHAAPLCNLTSRICHSGCGRSGGGLQCSSSEFSFSLSLTESECLKAAGHVKQVLPANHAIVNRPDAVHTCAAACAAACTFPPVHTLAAARATAWEVAVAAPLMAWELAWTITVTESAPGWRSTNMTR